MTVIEFRPLTGLFTKKCGTCRVTKPRREFHQDASRKDGLAARCRPCAAAAGKQSHAKKKAPPARTRKPPEVPPDAPTIVDLARATLLRAGYSPRDLDVLGLDGLMREANRRLVARGRPQLGNNPRWLA